VIGDQSTTFDNTSLNRAIDLRPDEPEYLETKSRVLRRMGRHEEAQKAFDKAMSLKLE